MSDLAQVTVHRSQFPERVRDDLLASLRTRRVNHKFHYVSVKQTQKWLALHQALSPARTDAAVVALYDRAFTETVPRITAPQVHVIGLGCGGGQKDTRLLRQLQAAGRQVAYTPCDVSVAMTLVARQTARDAIPELPCFPLVGDLAAADNLIPALTVSAPPTAARVITFFGMLPNFEPGQILPRLAALVRSDDTLLVSANLAPGPDYAAGLRRILPQYDNPLTRDWLLTFLLDLGFERGDGELRFTVEADPAGSGLKRVAARFHLTRPREVIVAGEPVAFQSGESIQLFFSYRHQAASLGTLLAGYGLGILRAWVAPSEEEGVFHVQKR